MATINSVTIGDERSSRDITQPIIKDYIKNGTLDFVSSSALIPVFDSSPTITLTDQEQQDIHDNAVKACGGNANDNRCIDSNVQTMQQQRLMDKKAEAQSSVNQIKGRRVNVSYTDSDGQTHEMVVPDGQKFHLDGLKQDQTSSDVGSLIPQPSAILLQVGHIIGVIVGIFLYVFSIAATYKTLASDYSRVIAIGGTTAAVVFPYSGYFIMIGYFLIREVYKYQMEDYKPKIMAWVIVALLVAAYASSATFVAMALASYSALKSIFFPPPKQ